MFLCLLEPCTDSRVDPPGGIIKLTHRSMHFDSIVCFRLRVSRMALRGRLLCQCSVLIGAMSFAPPCSAAAMPVPPTTGGGSWTTLGNPYVTARIQTISKHLTKLQIDNRETRRVIDIPELFTLTLADGTALRATEMQVVAPPTSKALSADPSAARYSERFPGNSLCAELADSRTSTHVRWCGILREGSAYFRQQISIHTDQESLPIVEVRLLQLTEPGAHVTGTVRGSPMTDGTMFFGFEHPLSVSTVENGQAVAMLQRKLPLRRGETVSYSSVVGFAPEGQMRRTFFKYLERERARPYQPFLHYNTWYDLGYEGRYNSAGALDRIHSFGTELVEKRGVKLDSFLFDDGWDDPNSLWNFDSGFPQGFTPEEQASAKYGFGIGVWLSPWGGYAEQKKERVAFGRKAGFEIVNDGFALSGPKYYERFEQVCLEMIRKYGVNQFKFDGTGNADRVFAGSKFDSDFDAAIHLIGDLRKAKPNLFINLTTGTYPSPFWLFYADSIWRGGEDHSFAGVGSSRQQWITYRDAQTYKNIVQQGPLFPLNSLMLHGLIYARWAEGLASDPSHDFADEVRSYFGSGTQLQEMYITPSLLSAENWDTLATAAKWARQNAETLGDSHWIGGDPARLQTYGWAAWSPKQGIVVLRNPSDKPTSFVLDAQTAFELPIGAPREYALKDQSAPNGERPEKLRAGQPRQIDLKPFEVRVLVAEPLGRSGR